MLTAAKWTMGIVCGGLVLGALLGDAANPTPEQPAPQWWQLTSRERVEEPEVYGFTEVGSYPTMPDGYRPDLDYDAEVWNLPLPDYDFAAFEDYGDEPFPAFAAAEPAPEPVEQAASEAEAAAGEALAAASVEPTPGDSRKSELALAGLY